MEANITSGVHLTPTYGELEDDPSMPMDQIYPALLESFGIILLGYLAGKFNIITDRESIGLNTFVGTFSLPALIFGSLCTINMNSVNWTFILAVLISKTLIFLGVLIVTYIVGKRAAPKAGLYAIFATQSNDFALGSPIVEAVYGKTHPNYVGYLYLMAPISLVILNPIGFVLMELGKQQENSSNVPKLEKFKNVIKGVSTNPIIFMTVLGVFGNFIFQGKLPQVIDGFLSSLGDAFSACALFLLGLKMVNKSDSKLSVGKFIGPGLLIAVKTIGMPIITEEIVTTFKPGGDNQTENMDLSDFGFLYGTFPTAPSVFVYATKYNLESDIIAAAMVACTFVSAPIMFISAKLLSLKNINPEDYLKVLDPFLMDISILSLFACLWVIFVLINSKKWKQMPNYVTILLVFSQACGCIGAILWSTMNCDQDWKLYLQFAFFAFGVYASRINTALIALTMLIQNIRSQHFVLKLRPIFTGIGIFAPAILVILMFSVVSHEKDEDYKSDPNFQFGITENFVSLILLSLSFLTTLISMILNQRWRRNRLSSTPRASSNTDDPTRYLLEDETETDEQNHENLIEVFDEEEGHHPNITTDIEELVPAENSDVSRSRYGSDSTKNCSRDCRERVGAGRYRCDSETRAYTSTLFESYASPPVCEAREAETDEQDHLKHTILLILLAISMFTGIWLCIWNLLMSKLSGVYIELVFLDGFLNFGQGLITFVIFGLDARYILIPLKKWFRKIIYGKDSLVLPDWEDLDNETKRHCQQFLKHHLSHCIQTLAHDLRFGLRSYKAVFSGREFVDWLIEADLASNRLDSIGYGRYLIKGRVLRHVNNYLDFYDDRFLYTFSPNRSE